MSKLRTAILISGRGSNMQALIDACKDESYPAEIVAVISDKENAGGLAIAAANQIDTHIVKRPDYSKKSDFESAIHDILCTHEPDLICLAGFMRILSAAFIAQWENKIINIHPSLLPDYKGLHVHERVIADGQPKSGCSVHFVVPEMDAGPIIVQKSVSVQEGDTPEQLAARVLEQEHIAYPEALRLIAEKRVRIVDGQVEIR